MPGDVTVAGATPPTLDGHPRSRPPPRPPLARSAPARAPTDEPAFAPGDMIAEPLPRRALPGPRRHGRGLRGRGPGAARAGRAQDRARGRRPRRRWRSSASAARSSSRARSPTRTSAASSTSPSMAGSSSSPWSCSQGETLAQRLRRAGPMSTEEALPVARQIAAALHAAHQAGIVHRDLKPGNVVLTEARGRPAPWSPTSASPAWSPARIAA